MPLRVVPCTDADALRANQIETQAYKAVNDPFGPFFFPDAAAVPADADDLRAQRKLQEKAADSSIMWVKVIDDALDGLMIAFAHWHIYAPGMRIPKQEFTSFGPGSDESVCEEFWTAMAEKRGELLGDRPRVYLAYLHTDPAHQRRGAGGMLVDWGVEKAAQLQLPAYLEASRAGKPLYLRHGFEEAASITYDLSKWGGEGTETVCCMMRMPDA